MQLPTSLTFPHWRAVVRHSIPNVLEGKIVPAVLFIAILEWSGTRAAVLGALAFALGAMLVRVLRKQTITGLPWLTTLIETALWRLRRPLTEMIDHTFSAKGCARPAAVTAMQNE